MEYSCRTFFCVVLLSCCTFFGTALFSCRAIFAFSCWAPFYSYCIFFLLHIFFCSTLSMLQFFMLHFFQFGPSLLTCFSFNSFHGALFFATFRHTVHFSHCTLSCRIHLMLHLFPVVHFSCYSLFTLDFCYIKTALNHATFPVSCQSS